MTKWSTKIFSIFSLLFFLSAVIGCSGEPVQNVALLRSGITKTAEMYEVTGLGAAAADANLSQAGAKQNAETVAYMQAVEILTEVLQGVGLQGAIGLSGINPGDQRITQIVSAELVNVQRTGNTEYQQQEDGSWLAAVTITYSNIEAERLSEKFSEDSIIQDVLKRSENTPDAYTGILFDLRQEYDFSSFLIPEILSQKSEKIVSVRHLSKERLEESGGFPFFSSIREAKNNDFIGNNPLTVLPLNYDIKTGRIILSGDAVSLINGNKQLISEGNFAIIY